jgi:tRNA threonylcarbamoyl adenosine modification protein YeaZ
MQSGCPAWWTKCCNPRASFAGIDRLAACSGPGTFTGVRIGLAFVRGLALVLNVPVIGITTFEALAASARNAMPDADCWVIQDARRGEVYVQGFGSDGKPLGEAKVLDHECCITPPGQRLGSGHRFRHRARNPAACHYRDFSPGHSRY